jgi:hypothetical protein
MRVLSGSTRGFVGVLCALIALGGACGAATSQMVVAPFAEARFSPIDPSRPESAQIAVLWGDPAKGASAFLLKLGRGEGPLHTHSSDYHLVVLQGTMKHWAAGQSSAEASMLDTGSYWYQPGNQAHGDACLSDECVMFVKFSGKRDGRLAEAGR